MVGRSELREAWRGGVLRVRVEGGGSNGKMGTNGGEMFRWMTQQLAVPLESN